MENQNVGGYLERAMARKKVFADNRENVRQSRKGQVGAIRRAIRIGREYEVIDNE